MMPIFYLLVFILFIVAMQVYFKIADRYNIIDHPNERSSHAEITIRGAGIIFLFAVVVATVCHTRYWIPGLGALTIGAISFLDDRLTLSNRIRLLCHLIAVTLIFIFLHIFGSFPPYVVAALYIMVIGIINMYNFMDGINGIMGGYTLVILAGLQYINLYRVNFIDADMIWLPLLACMVFLFYNFRHKARCFAGDVGSVSVAFWLTFLILKLIFLTHNWAYILFMVVYGIDSVMTIAHRLLLKQNIFKAHRLHFYQLLANEHRVSHLLISSCYALLQGGIICLIIFARGFSTAGLFAVSILPLMAVYLIVKPILMHKRDSRQQIRTGATQ
ncbi:MAG TPA: glycosyltransferase family 4 protein [Mucilaginibacter sp.]|nr:glycosyltransferase family 4 protein [Mucilaginibacter sp.]